MIWDMMGHEWAAELLAGQIARRTLRHAYLFTGPQGIGRRTFALRFAQAINCTEAPALGAACGKCRTCRQFAGERHPDLHIVAADRVGGTLKVDQVRELQHMLPLAPYAAGHRIALLLRFEEAHISAANALLKTLEEPASKVVLLLTASRPEKLPETILSRCQLLRLRPLPFDRLTALLQEQRGIPAEEARLTAHLSGGRPGIALRLLEQPEMLAQRNEWLEEHRRLLTAGRIARFEFAVQFKNDRARLRSLLDPWAGYWRDLMIVTASSAAPLTNLDRQAEIEAFAGQLETEAAGRMLLTIEETRDRLDRNANPQLAAEALLLSLPRLQGVE